jgi:hypothetical protein
VVSPDILLALASGVPVVLFGLFLLSLRPRTVESLFFGGFAVLWGAQAVTANLVRIVGSSEAARVAFLLSFALLPPAFLFLAHFAARVGLGGARWGPTLVVGALAAAASLVLALQPQLVLASVRVLPTGPSVAFGPLAGPLFFLPFFGMFYAVITELYFQYRAAPPGVSRQRSRGVLMAFALFASYNAVSSFLLFLNPAAAARLGGSIGVLPTQFIFGVGTALVVGIAVHVALVPLGGRVDRKLLAALALPPVVACVENVLANTHVATVDSTGVWRLATVAALGYVLARYQLFDIDLRLKRGIAQSTVAGAFVVVFFLVSNLAQNLVSDQYGQFVGLGAAALLAFLDKPLKQFAERVAQLAMPGVRDDALYLDARKREVYRSALERVLVDGKVTPDEDVLLRGLQKSLGLTAKECKALEQDTRRALASPA